MDHPEIKVDEHESTTMPFRYVLDKEGQPIFPPVSATSTSQRHDDTDITTGHDRSD